MNGAFGDLGPEFEQFTLDALSSPQKIIFGHLLYQVDDFGGQPGTTAAVAGFEIPEEPKGLTMPAQQGIELEDEEGSLPILDAAGKEREPQPIGWSEAWLFDLAVENDELLTEGAFLATSSALMHARSVAVESTIEW